MKRTIKLILAISAGVFLGTALVASAAAGGVSSEHASQGASHAAVCVPGGKDTLRCHARVVVDRKGNPITNATPSGLGPNQFHTAYASSANAPTPQVIAIVDAYDHPNIYSDLSKYSSTFGIPVLPQCTGLVASSNVPCFQKVNQNGQTSPLPKANAGWALEIALDVEAAHAMCQNCSILLVEANSNSFANLMAAVDTAARLGADEISNSYGANEFSGQTAYDSHFNHPGVAITVSAGDSGYGAEYPAASQYVTSVGGTSLYFNLDGTYRNESVWRGTGSGCSAYETKPSWQSDTLCVNRTLNDVSLVADPNTGAAVYDSVRYSGRSGWFIVGGTSLSSPRAAGMYALAGGVGDGTYGSSILYTNGTTANLHDVASGSNGSCGTALCNAVVGYDGPTGLGTPNGSGAF